MPSSLPSGFLTKKEACRRYKRSHRQLTRDLGAAMRASDERVLQNFRLRSEDGQSREGTEVSSDLISKLRLEGHNPMWYVRATWMEKTYGPRGEPREESAPQPSEEPAGDRGAPNAPDVHPDITQMYGKQMERIEEENARLRDELKIKNEQIRESNERQKETNVLMRDLHVLMKDLQQRLLPAPESKAPALTHGHVVATSEAADATPLEKGSGSPKRHAERTKSKASAPKRADVVALSKAAAARPTDKGIDSPPRHTERPKTARKPKRAARSRKASTKAGAPPKASTKSRSGKFAAIMSRLFRS